MGDLARAPAPGVAAVVGEVQPPAEQVDAMIVVGIDPDAREVERPGVEVADMGPRVAAIFGAEDPAAAQPVVERPADPSALVGLDDRHQDLRVAMMDVDTDTACLGG